jgi:hypothetical protein
MKIQVAGSSMKLCGITFQKTVTFIMIYSPWQCSSVGSLTLECEETNLSVFLLLTGSCDHTTTESVQALCFSHNTDTHKPNHPSYTLQLLESKALCKNGWHELTNGFEMCSTLLHGPYETQYVQSCVPIGVKNSATSWALTSKHNK